ncbi:hypothetical protein JTB14_025651 [Gonioctena quinquepunctata]|nr:hypothetical protein JTB14_025651 [Gonioctena quinquepunctata]
MTVVPNDEVVAMFRELKQQNDEIQSQNNQLVIQFKGMELEIQNYEREVEECIQKTEKETGVYISIDHANENYNKRKLLMSQRKLARERGDTAYIKGHMLVVYGESWTNEEILKNLRSNQSVLSPAASGSKKEGTEESSESIEHRSKKASQKRSTRAASRSGEKNNSH